MIDEWRYTPSDGKMGQCELLIKVEEWLVWLSTLRKVGPLRVGPSFEKEGRPRLEQSTHER